MIHRLTKQALKFSEKEIRELAIDLGGQGNYEVIEGDSYVAFFYSTDEKLPLLFGHYDTLIDPDTKIEFQEDRHPELGLHLRNVNGAMGAPSRCGVALILRMLMDNEKAHFAIFGHFMTGSLGSAMFIRKYEELVRLSVSCYIGLDRRGAHEAGTYSVRSFRMLKILQEHQFYNIPGHYSDVLMLIDRVPLPAVSLSCGYYLPHSVNEYVVIDHVQRTRDALLDILRKLQEIELDDVVDDEATMEV